MLGITKGDRPEAINYLVLDAESYTIEIEAGGLSVKHPNGEYWYSEKEMPEHVKVEMEKFLLAIDSLI